MADPFRDMFWSTPPPATLTGRPVRTAPPPPRRDAVRAWDQTPSQRRTTNALIEYGLDPRRANLVGAVVPWTPMGAAYDIGHDFLGPAIVERDPLAGAVGVGLGALAALPGGVASRAGARIAKGLPMDAASRDARRRAMGYSDTPFYRGDMGTRTEYHGGFFTRDPSTARGHAVRHQGNPDAQPREFRLNLQRNFRMNAPVPADTADFMAMIVEDANPALASAIREASEAGLSGFHVYHLIDRSGVGVEDVLRRAGFNSIDMGTDVRMLSGSGIRSAEAAFDPRRSRSRNIFYGMAPLGAALVPFAAPSDDR